MAYDTINMPSMVTSGGSDTSSTVKLMEDAFGLTIYAPTTLTSTGNVIEVEPTSTGTSFVVLQSGGTDVVFTAGKATVISPVAWKQMRIVGTAAEADTRTFRLTKTVQT